jgi:Restriction endonuclease S subunits
MSGNEKKVPKRRFKEFEDAEGWKQRKFVDTVDISTNMVDPKTGDFDTLPHIGPGNIESFTGRLLDNVNTVKEDNLISGKFHFDKGDVIYGKINPQLGKYVYAPYEGLASADAYVLNAKNGLVQTFLFTLLQTRHFFNYSVSVSMRSGMPKINRDELNVYSFMSPCDKEQEKIGNFFLDIDNLITLHQRKLDKMKALKKAYLTDMFPAKGERKPKLRFAGFTDDWEQRKLGDLADIVRGASPRPIQDPKWFDDKSTVGWLRISDVSEQDGRIHYLEQHISKAGQEKTRVLKQSHLLLSIAASVGKPVINYVSTGVHDGFLIFQNPTFDQEFMFQWMKMFEGQWQKYGQPGSQVNLNSDIVKNQVILIPKEEEQDKIGEFFSELDNLITLHQRKLEKLQNIKKAYLNEMFI